MLIRWWWRLTMLLRHGPAPWKCKNCDGPAWSIADEHYGSMCSPCEREIREYV